MCINTSLTQAFKNKTKHNTFPLCETWPALVGEWVFVRLGPTPLCRRATAPEETRSADPRGDTQAHTFRQKRTHGSGRK